MGNIEKNLPMNDTTQLDNALISNIFTNLKVADVGQVLQIISDVEGEALVNEWKPRTSVNGIRYGEVASAYYWSNQNPYASFDLCLANCTCYVYGRQLEQGSTPPTEGTHNAGNWHSYVSNGWEAIVYDSSQLTAGDIIEWPGHVAVYEGDGFVSGSYYTGDDGTGSSNRAIDSYWTAGTSTSSYKIKSTANISSWLSTATPSRFFHYQTIADETSQVGANPTWILKNPGGFDNSRKKYIVKSITNNLIYECYGLQNLKILETDVVAILFTDVDFRTNLALIKQGESIQNIQSQVLHSSSYGIVIGKI